MGSGGDAIGDAMRSNVLPSPVLTPMHRRCNVTLRPPSMQTPCMHVRWHSLRASIFLSFSPLNAHIILALILALVSSRSLVALVSDLSACLRCAVLLHAARKEMRRTRRSSYPNARRMHGPPASFTLLALSRPPLACNNSKPPPAHHQLHRPRETRALCSCLSYPCMRWSADKEVGYVDDGWRGVRG
eukprot:9257816-Pyramimonas_sp.AAC.1